MVAAARIYRSLVISAIAHSRAGLPGYRICPVPSLRYAGRSHPGSRLPLRMPARSTLAPLLESTIEIASRSVGVGLFAAALIGVTRIIA